MGSGLEFLEGSGVGSAEGLAKEATSGVGLGVGVGEGVGVGIGV